MKPVFLLAPAPLLWVFAPPLLAALISTVASICLLRWLQHARPEHRNKLIVRQLWHLALADTVFGLFAAVALTLNLLSYFDRTIFALTPAGMARLCVAVSEAYSIGWIASITIELNLALACVAAISRWPRILDRLHHMLLLTWPLSIALSCVEVYGDSITWLRGQGCTGQADITSITVESVYAPICVACYVCGAVQVCVAGEGVRYRVWNRARFYILAWLVCSLPNLIRVSVRNELIETSPVLHCLALTLFTLNGLFNTIVYALRGCCVRCDPMMASSDGQRPRVAPPSCSSFHVRTDGGVEVVDVPAHTDSSRTDNMGADDAIASGSTFADAQSRGSSIDAICFNCFEIPSNPRMIRAASARFDSSLLQNLGTSDESNSSSGTGNFDGAASSIVSSERTGMKYSLADAP
eukprot:TRINITY_DN26922_c0_g1_i1.p1 TRINITY_DN26922_c0_g1~~TRINITY_DN26922_c0_g1_i1.p1  ORF type:complete len:410 (-),score=29.71 TRINITY_DN26922_c0_g1_i1:394-1623(-)